MNRAQMHCAFDEVSILERCEHHGVMKLRDYFHCDKYICIVTDLMDMSLLQYLNDN